MLSAFHALLAVCVSSVEKCSFKSFAPILTGLFLLQLLHSRSFICILDTNPEQIRDFQIFLPSVFFTLLIVSFDAEKFLIFTKSN